MKFQPINSTVIVALDQTPEKTDSGLYIPDRARLPKATGTVKAIGRGILMMTGQVIPLQVKVGDRVYVTIDAEEVKKIDFDGEACIALPDERMILGVLEG